MKQKRCEIAVIGKDEPRKAVWVFINQGLGITPHSYGRNLNKKRFKKFVAKRIQ